MNYRKLYDSLVSFRQSNPATGYTEKHHILMRSMGGSDDPTNLVVLTGREHWIAHLLLHKIHRHSVTAYACYMMSMRCEERGIHYIKNSRMYEAIRKECAKLTSIRNSALQRGSNNSQYGTRWISNYDLKENRKILKDDPVPDGWVIGRNKWNVEKSCLKCKTNFLQKCNEKFCSNKCKKLFILENKKPITENTRLILSKSSKKRAAENPKTIHINTIWVNDGIVNKRIDKSSNIELPWVRGKLKRVYAL